MIRIRRNKINEKRCKDQSWVPSPHQNNEFVESELENWALVNQTIDRVVLILR